MRKAIFVASVDWINDQITSVTGETFAIATRGPRTRNSLESYYCSGSPTTFRKCFQPGELIVLKKTRLVRENTPLWEKVEEGA